MRLLKTYSHTSMRSGYEADKELQEKKKREKGGLLVPERDRKYLVVHQRNIWSYHQQVGGGGGVLIIMHGRSRMPMDSRTSTMQGRSASGFMTRQTLLAPSAKRASRMKGELHSTKNRF